MSRLPPPQPGPIALRTEHHLEVFRPERSWRWHRARYQLHAAAPYFVVQEACMFTLWAIVLAQTDRLAVRTLWVFPVHAGLWTVYLVLRCGRAPTAPDQWLDGRPPVAYGRIELRHPEPDDRRELRRTIDRTVRRALGFRLVDARTLSVWPQYPMAVRERALFGIFDRHDASAAGAIFFSDFTEGGRTATIRLWLGPSHRGQRLGPDALTAASHLAWSLGIATIRAVTALDNAAMVRVLESAGATLVDKRKDRLPNHRRVASACYELRNPGFTISG